MSHAGRHKCLAQRLDQWHVGQISHESPISHTGRFNSLVQGLDQCHVGQISHESPNCHVSVHKSWHRNQI